MSSHDMIRLAELRSIRAARRDVDRMTPEAASDWMDEISKSVGNRAMQMEQNLRADIRDANDTLKQLNKAWKKWDWRTLNDLGILSRDDYKFAEDFDASYTR